MTQTTMKIHRGIHYRIALVHHFVSINERSTAEISFTREEEDAPWESMSFVSYDKFMNSNWILSGGKYVPENDASVLFALFCLLLLK